MPCAACCVPCALCHAVLCQLDNTLLTEDDPPFIKICDFGFARGTGGSDSFQCDTVIGTPDYMSPQMTGSKILKRAPVTTGDAGSGGDGGVVGKTAGHPGYQSSRYDGMKADVWAMGVMLTVLVLGRFPFEAGPAAGEARSDPLDAVSGGRAERHRKRARGLCIHPNWHRQRTRCLGVAPALVRHGACCAKCCGLASGMPRIQLHGASRSPITHHSKHGTGQESGGFTVA